MKYFFTLSAFLFITFTAMSQQKKPVTKKPTSQPSKEETKPVPVKSEEQIQQEMLFKIQKAKQDSLAMVEEVRKKIELELLEEKRRIENEELQKKQRYEEALRLEKEANDRRLAEEALLESKKFNNKFGWGGKFGRSFSTISTSELGSINKTYLQAFTYGVFLNLPVGKRVAIMPEINYITKGLRYEYETDFDQLKMNSVALPLMVRVDVFSKQLFRVYTKMGGYGSYWLNGKIQSEIDSESFQLNYEFDNNFDDGFKDNRIDYGASAALGLAVKIRSSIINVEARYDYGLSPIGIIETKPEDYLQPFSQSFNVCLSLQF